MRNLKIAVSIVLLFCIICVGALAETINVVFPADIGENICGIQIDFDADLFLQPSDVYDQRLARLSLCMAVAAFRSETVTYINSDSNIRSFFEQANFINYQADQYEMLPTAETIASAIAMRELSDGSTLVAIAVSGQGYRNEWMSNFAVGGTEMHAGFRKAANTVYDRFQAYVEQHKIKGPIRVWTSGFSRAAATANLLAARILQTGEIESNHVFAYTFGTPSTTKTPIEYPQIFNIVNSFDPVGFIPFANWRYGKHGITKYLPAAEVDINYDSKTANAAKKFTEITGMTKGFHSNVNANWLLSKVMETLYRILPESEFYSDEFQQTLIDTWAKEGDIWEKMSFMIDQVIKNNSLMNAMQNGGAGAGTLLAQGLYSAYTEIAGMTTGKWADLFTGASQLVHEHMPSVYLAWLMSTDDPNVLFDHPTAYTRLICSADMDLTVEDENGNKITGTRFSRFTLNGQVYYAIPEGMYTIRLSAHSDKDGLVALRYHDIRRVSENLFKTGLLKLDSGDELVLVPDEYGRYTATLNGEEIELEDEGSHGLSSIAGELTLSGSNGIIELLSLTSNAIAVVVPHVLSMIIILLYFISMLIYKLFAHSRNEIVETHRFGRWLLVLVSAACTITASRHLYYCVLEMVSKMPELENRMAIMAASMLGMGTVIYQLTDALMYGMLAVLAWRGRIRHRSRIRGRRLAGLFMFIKLCALGGAKLVEQVTFYDVACVVFFFGCFIAFIIVRNARYEKDMKQRRYMEKLRLKEQRRLERQQAKA